MIQVIPEYSFVVSSALIEPLIAAWPEARPMTKQGVGVTLTLIS